MLRLFFQRVSHDCKADRVLCAYRSEAKTVPNLLVAPVSPTVESKKTELYGDYPQGYYSDGAYTAIPLPHSNPTRTHTNGGQKEDEDEDPQEAYYASLSARFTELSKILQSLPPRTAPTNTDVYYVEWRGIRLWRAKILNTTPNMVLLAQLTQESVVCGLGVLPSLLTLANLKGERGKKIGAWAWGLLGRCRDVGQMSSEEVGVLRKLGKQAVWLLRRISAGEIIGAENEPDEDPEEEEEKDDEENEEGKEELMEDGADPPDAADVEDGYSPSIDPITTTAITQNGNSDPHPPAPDSASAIAKAKQQILDSLQTSTSTPTPTHPVTEPEPEVDGEEGGYPTEKNSTADDDKRAKMTIHPTLDMLVTIIGEFYGQRDLLDGRLLWDEMQ